MKDSVACINNGYFPLSLTPSVIPLILKHKVLLKIRNVMRLLKISIIYAVIILKYISLIVVD